MQMYAKNVFNNFYYHEYVFFLHTHTVLNSSTAVVEPHKYGWYHLML